MEKVTITLTKRQLYVLSHLMSVEAVTETNESGGGMPLDAKEEMVAMMLNMVDKKPEAVADMPLELQKKLDISRQVITFKKQADTILLDVAHEFERAAKENNCDSIVKLFNIPIPNEQEKEKEVG